MRLPLLAPLFVLGIMKVELIESGFINSTTFIIWVALVLIFLSSLLTNSDAILFNLIFFALVISYPFIVLYLSSKTAHLKFGADESNLYFPLDSGVMQFFPLSKIEYVTFSKIPIKDYDHDWHETQAYRDVVSIKMKNIGPAESWAISKPLWGDLISPDNGQVYIFYLQRKKALKVIEGVNQLLKLSNEATFNDI